MFALHYGLTYANYTMSLDIGPVFCVNGLSRSDFLSLFPSLSRALALSFTCTFVFAH